MHEPTDGLEGPDMILRRHYLRHQQHRPPPRRVGVVFKSPSDTSSPHASLRRHAEPAPVFVRLLHDDVKRQQAVVLSAHHALLDAQSLAVLVRLLCEGPGALTPATAPGSRATDTLRRPT